MSDTSTNYRLGADVGGTFTDVCAKGPSGDITRAKVPTTPQDQRIGIQHGIHKIRQKLNWTDGDQKFQYIHHGTTIATNAVLEGEGARTGLIVTAGHRDTLAVRRSQIPGGLGAWLHYCPPEPVVPLERVVECYGRIGVDGVSVTEVDRERLRGGLEGWKRGDERPGAVVISLLNAHSSNSHEPLVADIVKEELGGDVTVISSSDVMREVGKCERKVTACTNGLVKRVMQSYLEICESCYPMMGIRFAF